MQHEIRQNLKSESKANRRLKNENRKRTIKTVLNK